MASRLASALANREAIAAIAMPTPRYAAPGWFLGTDLRRTTTLQSLEQLDSFGNHYVARLSYEWLNECAWGTGSDALAQALEFGQTKILTGDAPEPPEIQNALFDPHKLEQWCHEQGIPQHAPDWYHQGIKKIKHHLRNGDCYQINYTTRFRFKIPLEKLYETWLRNLRQFRPPFASWIDDGNIVSASLSPEELCATDGNFVCSSPIKGTSSRLQPALDSSKNLAEHTMIVDLVRNDLSALDAATHTQVTEFARATEFGGIDHLVSHICTQTQKSVSQIMRKIAPGGSITGAPKRRTTQIIHAIETTPRSLYCGAIGLGQHSQAVFSLPIRTALWQAGECTVFSGGGIVYDSDAEAEWQELRRKLYWIV